MRATGSGEKQSICTRKECDSLHTSQLVLPLHEVVKASILSQVDRTCTYEERSFDPTSYGQNERHGGVITAERLSEIPGMLFLFRHRTRGALITQTQPGVALSRPIDANGSSSIYDDPTASIISRATAVLGLGLGITRGGTLRIQIGVNEKLTNKKQNYDNTALVCFCFSGGLLLCSC